MSADTIFLFEKVSLFFVGMRLGEIGVDATFPTVEAAASAERFVDLIICDEVTAGWNLCQTGFVFSAVHQKLHHTVQGIPCGARMVTEQ